MIRPKPLTRQVYYMRHRKSAYSNDIIISKDELYDILLAGDGWLLYSNIRDKPRWDFCSAGSQIAINLKNTTHTIELGVKTNNFDIRG